MRSHEMTSKSDRTLKMWANFPPDVRNDICFKAFKDEYGEWTNKSCSRTLTISTTYFIADIETLNANHALLDEKRCAPKQNTRFNWQNVMYGIFFVLWLISFWYYVTIREHAPKREILSIDSTEATCEIHIDSKFCIFVFFFQNVSF